ncbi:MAG: CRISPR-associated endonuclease Cas1 [Desulfovibrio sp.]|nr:CRISPR-associated endonuclease Cas1 [Desulfovibrio sp.]
MIAYVTTQGSRIEKDGRRLIVRSERGAEPLFVSVLEQLILVGNVAMTAPARRLLLKEGIDTVFMQKNGRYLGRMHTKDPANVLLRKRQFLLTDDSDFRMRVAKRMVLGKIGNQATVISRIKRSKGSEEAGKVAAELQRLARLIDAAPDPAALRGIEGRAAAVYFDGFRLGLQADWGFTRRIRRPPPDPVNVVLSFLYTLLASRCVAALRVAGLDPQPGILHEISYGRDSLALDLMEEFRPMLADTLTLALFNKNVLTADDFIVPDAEAPQGGSATEDGRIRDALDDPLGQMTAEPAPYDEDDGIGDDIWTGDDEGAENTFPEEPRRPLYLSQQGAKSLLTAWSKKLETAFFHPVTRKQTDYAEAIVWQARLLRKVVEGQAEDYAPLMLR